MVYIGILVTSTTTGHDGSVVSALASQAIGRGSIPSCGTSFFSHKHFLSSLSKLREKVIEQANHQFGQILSGDGEERECEELCRVTISVWGFTSRSSVGSCFARDGAVSLQADCSTAFCLCYLSSQSQNLDQGRT